MSYLTEGREEEMGISGRKVAVLGIGNCGINLISHLEELLGPRDDVKVLAFQRRSLHLEHLEKFRAVLWDDTDADGQRLTMTESFDNIDRALVEVEEHIDGFDVIMLAAGLGGLTGSYTAVRIAHLLDDSPKEVIAFVVTPLSLEGQRKIDPRVSLSDLKRKCDVVLVASNERVMEIADNVAVNTALAKARLLLEQVVRKVLDNAPDGGQIVITDPERLAEVHTNERSSRSTIGLRMRHGYDKEIERLQEGVRKGITDRGALYQAYDEIYARNDEIRAMLRADLTAVVEQLVEEIDRNDAIMEEEIDRNELYGVIRALLVSALDDDHMLPSVPYDLLAERSFVQDVVLHLVIIDVVIERLGSSLSNGLELAQNLKRYVIDFMKGLIGILEDGPQHMRKEVVERLPELHQRMREQLHHRAGVADTSGFIDDRLLVSIVTSPVVWREWGRL